MRPKITDEMLWGWSTANRRCSTCRAEPGTPCVRKNRYYGRDYKPQPMDSPHKSRLKYAIDHQFDIWPRDRAAQS